MTATGHGGHPGMAELLDYWFGDADEATTAALDEHLMACDACGAELDRVAALARGVRDALDAGCVVTVVTPGVVDRLVARGVQVRRYRVPHNGSVACSVSPEDELLVGIMEAPLHGVQRLDLAADFSCGDGTVWLHDVPFDAASGAVVLVPQLAAVRRMPEHELRVRLLATRDGGSQEIGHYLFRHSTSW